MFGKSNLEPLWTCSIGDEDRQLIPLAMSLLKATSSSRRWINKQRSKNMSMPK